MARKSSARRQFSNRAAVKLWLPLVAAAALFGAFVLARWLLSGERPTAADKLIGVWEGSLDKAPAGNTPAEKKPATTDAAKDSSDRKHPLAEIPSSVLEQVAMVYSFSSEGELRIGIDAGERSMLLRLKWQVLEEDENTATIRTFPSGNGQTSVGELKIEFLEEDRFRLRGMIDNERTSTFRRVSK